MVVLKNHFFIKYQERRNLQVVVFTTFEVKLPLQLLIVTPLCFNGLGFLAGKSQMVNS